MNEEEKLEKIDGKVTIYKKNKDIIDEEYERLCDFRENGYKLTKSEKKFMEAYLQYNERGIMYYFIQTLKDPIILKKSITYRMKEGLVNIINKLKLTGSNKWIL